MDKFTVVILLILLLVFGVICGPLISLWAINTLAAAAGTSFAIPYTLKTWFAMLLIGGLFTASGRSSS